MINRGVSSQFFSQTLTGTGEFETSRLYHEQNLSTRLLQCCTHTVSLILMLASTKSVSVIRIRQQLVLYQSFALIYSLVMLFITNQSFAHLVRGLSFINGEQIFIHAKLMWSCVGEVFFKKINKKVNNVFVSTSNPNITCIT